MVNTLRRIHFHGIIHEPTELTLGHIYCLLHVTSRAHVDLDSTLCHASEAFTELMASMTMWLLRQVPQELHVGTVKHQSFAGGGTWEKCPRSLETVCQLNS